MPVGAAVLPSVAASLFPERLFGFMEGTGGSLRVLRQPYGPLGLAWLQRQADIAEQLIRARAQASP